MSICRLCPRECKVDREKSLGVCGAGVNIKIAKYMLHMWEEPCISGNGGSGAIFFSHCPLKCVYCQNTDISHGGNGYEVSEDELGEIMLKLQSQGAHNINLVTPTHYSDKIKRVLDKYRDRIKIPIVYNTSGYEKSEIIDTLKGYVDIFLCDIKYFSPEISGKYSLASDYYEKALASLKSMVKIAPECEFDSDGIMKKGVIVRHLVLPSQRLDSIKILEDVAKNVDISKIKLSLMSQYTPEFYCGDDKALKRRVTTFEYQSVTERAIELGYDGYIQDKASATKIYTPDFSGKRRNDEN
jgi:putative pyruvate formate lyase activating enzyme